MRVADFAFKNRGAVEDMFDIELDAYNETYGTFYPGKITSNSSETVVTFQISFLICLQIRMEMCLTRRFYTV